MSAIKAGDNVYMVGNPMDLICSHVQQYLGLPIKVVEIVNGHLQCSVCERIWHDVDIALTDRKYPNALRVSWLKKMEPPKPEELEQSYSEGPAYERRVEKVV